MPGPARSLPVWAESAVRPRSDKRPRSGAVPAMYLGQFLKDRPLGGNPGNEHRRAHAQCLALKFRSGIFNGDLKPFVVGPEDAFGDVGAVGRVEDQEIALPVGLPFAMLAVSTDRLDRLGPARILHAERDHPVILEPVEVARDLGIGNQLQDFSRALIDQASDTVEIFTFGQWHQGLTPSE